MWFTAPTNLIFSSSEQLHHPWTHRDAKVTFKEPEKQIDNIRGRTAEEGEEFESLKGPPFWLKNQGRWARSGEDEFGDGGKEAETGTFSAEGQALLLFMLMFFMEMRVMLCFSPLAVEQLCWEGSLGYRAHRKDKGVWELGKGAQPQISVSQKSVLGRCTTVK